LLLHARVLRAELDEPEPSAKPLMKAARRLGNPTTQKPAHRFVQQVPGKSEILMRCDHASRVILAALVLVQQSGSLHQADQVGERPSNLNAVVRQQLG